MGREHCHLFVPAMWIHFVFDYKEVSNKTEKPKKNTAHTIQKIAQAILDVYFKM